MLILFVGVPASPGGNCGRFGRRVCFVAYLESIDELRKTAANGPKLQQRLEAEAEELEKANAGEH